MTLAHGSPALYAIENVSFCAMLLVVIAMQGRIGGVGWAKKIHPFAVSVGALVCLASLAAPFIMPRAGLSFMMAYSI